MALGALDNKIDSPSLGGGGGLKIMNPMESMVSTFKDMRDGILDLMIGIDSLVSATKAGFSGLNKHLAFRFETIVAAISMSPQPTAAEAIAGADTDTGGKKEEEEKPKKGMIDSIRDKMGEGGFDKLKKALFVGVVASLLIFSKQLESVIAPLLKAGKKIFELLGPKGSLIAGLGLLAFLKFGKPLTLAIKLAKFAMIGLKAGLPILGGALSSLAAGLMTVASSIFGFITATLVPFVIAFAIPIAIITAVIVGVVAAIHSIKKGIEAFKTSLDQGDSMFEAIVKGITTALITLATLPATLFTKLVGFVAGLLGFDNVKDKLMNIDFVGAVTDSLFNMFTKAKDFVMSIFDIDFAGMFGKVLDIGKMIVGRIKAIGAAGFAAVKAAFPGGESPMEAFKRVYAERTSGSGVGDSEPKEVGSIDDVAKLKEDTAEKTHEADESGNSKLSSTRKEERAAIMAEGFSKQDAKQIRLFDYSDKGFAKYFKTSMDTLGYAFESPFLSSAEKLAWMKDKAMPDDDGNMVKLSEGGEYDIQASPAGGGEMVAGSSSAAGEKLNEATAENKQAKDNAAKSSGSPIIVNNNNTTNSSSTSNTTNNPLSADHSDPTANTLKQLSGIV
mgnify:CR=1 FL=1